MAVLTKTTDIHVGEIEKLQAIFSAKPNPSKAAFDRIAKAKTSPVYRGGKDGGTN